MSYATLMVYVENAPSRIRLAADLAKRLEASLIGIAARASMPVVTGEDAAIDSALLDQENAGIKAFLDKAGEDFRAATSEYRIPVEWRSAPDVPDEFVAAEARAADLLIVGQISAAAYRSLEVASLLLKAGRPVLVVPKDVATLAIRRVVVAWKDTREARRAIRDALPLLSLAESVFLVEVCAWGAEANAMPRLKDVGRFLAQHQISNVTERVLPDEPIAGDVLLRFVQEQSADLIVAGAYGHSRLGEWIFGGVTRALLTRSPACCLFSH
jgi:nucleotide-binding universal stress UspA family protein